MYLRKWHHHRFREEETFSFEVLVVMSLRWEQKAASSLGLLVLPWRQWATSHKWGTCCGCRSSPTTQPLLPAAGRGTLTDVCAKRSLWQEARGKKKGGRLLLTVFETCQSKGPVRPNLPTPLALKAHSVSTAQPCSSCPSQGLTWFLPQVSNIPFPSLHKSDGMQNEDTFS